MAQIMEPDMRYACLHSQALPDLVDRGHATAAPTTGK